MKKKFKVSVVMAVYNVKEYLSESIESLIEQDFGFENIQLILVDDGSTDDSGKICDKYVNKYPDNIFVIHKENGGVSSARNAGLEVVKGELVNFLDSDDKLTPETVRNAYKFYADHKNEIDVVTIPMIFFEGKTGEHTLNYKFNRGSRVIDLDKEWNVCQLQVGATFICVDALQGLRFDNRLNYAEDAHLLQRVLARKCKIGVLKEGGYLYRQRVIGAESALQSARGKKGWYIPYFKYFQMNIIDFYKEKYGIVPRFIQYVLMYDIQWRLKMDQIPRSVLTENEEKEFLQLLYGMFQYFDDEVILAQRNIPSEYKVFIIKKKYGKCVVQYRDNDIVLGTKNLIVSKMSQCSCRLEFLNIDKSEFCLEGRVFVYAGMEEKINIKICINDKYYPCECSNPESFTYSLGEEILSVIKFKICVPIRGTEDLNISFWMEKAERMILLEQLAFGTFFPVSKTYKSAYAVENNWKIVVKDNSLCLIQVNEKEKAICERDFLKELWKHNATGERKAVIARVLRRIFMKLKNKPIWLLEDRANKAGDNGEALFRFMRQNHPEIKSYFIIAKDCCDYKRMKKIGPVLAKDSFRHKLVTLMCDYLCSSQGEADVYNPFIGYSEPYRDILAKNKFIFLQHGIIHNDLSDWLDRYKKNITGFVTSVIPEYNSIVEGKYNYTKEKIWLTGLPRYDRLYCNEEKQITIMPTWRKYLLSNQSRETKSWSLATSFKESKYLQFYNGLINHPQLLKIAEENGYKIVFFPHPNLQEHLYAFDKNEQVKFLGLETEYRDVYAKSNLVVTDYSSAVFDFAYLRKPVIYAQFDKEEFYSGEHTLTKGYFDYEKDGFGEVEYDLESVVGRICEYMKNGCKMKDEYRKRADEFFAFNDQNNCQRVFTKIMELEEK